nr:GILT-like protein 1 [Onthophagus taurus]
MFLLTLFLVLIPQTISQTPRLKMSIYYETLCSDSVNFIKNQLAPNYDAIKKDVDFDLIPFGKATHSKKLDDDWTFLCQHGPQECNGNMLQACGLKFAANQDDKINFVNCVMSAKNPSAKTTTKKCAESNGISWDDLHNCYNSKVGRELLARNGDKTYNVQPSINYIPTIIFDNKYDYYLQNRAMYDLKGTVKGLVDDLNRIN